MVKLADSKACQTVITIFLDKAVYSEVIKFHMDKKTRFGTSNTDR